jgi:hypothetical protein
MEEAIRLKDMFWIFRTAGTSCRGMAKSITWMFLSVEMLDWGDETISIH